MRPIQRRLLVALIVVVGLLLLGLVLFCVLVFNPFEGSVSSLVAIVPKGVSVLTVQPEPGRAMQELLASPFVANLQEAPSWQAFLESPTFRDLDAAYSIRSNLEQLLDAPKKAPIDVWEELLGREAAVACYPRSDKISRWDFLLYTRVGWKIRAGVDWSTSSLVTSRLGSDVTLTKLDGGGVEAVLRRGDKEHRLYYGRVRDVLVLSNKEKLLGDALRLGSQGPALSLQNDPEYRRSTAASPRSDDRSVVSFYGDVAKLRGEFGLDEKIQNALVDNPLMQVAAKVLSPTRLRASSGTTTFADVPRFAGAFYLDERNEAEHEKRITGAAPLERSAIESRYSALVPAQEFFFGFVKCPAPDLFALMATQFDSKDRKLVDDTLKKKGTNLDDFLQRSASHFGDELAISLSRIAYARLPYRPFPAVTIYFQVTDEAGFDEFLHFLTDDQFAIGNTRQESACGLPYVVGEQKAKIIAWADELAWARVGDRWILSSSEAALKEVLCVAAKQKPSLFETPAWQRSSSALASSENAVGFVQFAPFLDWANDYSGYYAERTTKIKHEDWPDLRAQFRTEIRAQHPKATDEELEKLIDQRAEDVNAANINIDVPQAQQRVKQHIEWFRGLSGLSAGIVFAPDRFDLNLGLDFTFMH
jgi:hypothetical protein